MPGATTYVPPALVPTGSRVILVVSRGPQPTPPAAYLEVPDVTGHAQGQALAALQSAGFNARVFNDYSDSFARGRVMGQLPSGGTTSGSGSEVVLLVSSGPAASHTSSQQLPDVVGKEEADAVNDLNAVNLVPQVTREYSPTVPAGIVMAQLPNRGWLSTVPERRSNTVVWLVTALLLIGLAVVAFFLLGQRARTTVPDVVGLTQADAVVRLQRAGLSSTITNAENPGSATPGTVAEQDPVAGTSVQKNSRVTLAVVPAEQSLVRVPSVRGLTQAEAVQALEALGLSADTRTRPDDIADPGTVVAQDPTQGAKVPAGTTVQLTLAEAPRPTAVDVPQVTGVTQADAEATLDGLGLDTLVVQNPSAEVAEGVVIAQLPAAGEAADAGASVAIIVSSGAPADASTVAVPGVVRDQLPDAQESVARAGLKSQPVVGTAAGAASNVVIAQWPEGAADAPTGSTVVLLYAR